MRRIYLDHNETTRPDSAVREEMLSCLDDVFGNPSSVHSSGQESRRILDRARKRVAKLIGATADEILFTSGGTESNNHAVSGIAESLGDRKRHIVTTAIEHQALLHPCNYLEGRGFEITYLPVDENGLVDAQDVSRALRDDTALTSVMLANNDVGSIHVFRRLDAVLCLPCVESSTDGVLDVLRRTRQADQKGSGVGETGCDRFDLIAHHTKIAGG